MNIDTLSTWKDFTSEEVSDNELRALLNQHLLNLKTFILQFMFQSEEKDFDLDNFLGFLCMEEQMESLQLTKEESAKIYNLYSARKDSVKADKDIFKKFEEVKYFSKQDLKKVFPKRNPYFLYNLIEKKFEGIFAIKAKFINPGLLSNGNGGIGFSLHTTKKKLLEKMKPEKKHQAKKAA